jgi:hypothetical protein
VERGTKWEEEGERKTGLADGPQIEERRSDFVRREVKAKAKARRTHLAN